MNGARSARAAGILAGAQLFAALLLGGVTCASSAFAHSEGGWLAVRAAKVIASADLPEPEILNPGVVLIHEGKIRQVGRPEDVTLPEGCQVVDRGSGWVVPGFIDLHCHVGGPGYNDMVYLNNPDLVSSPNIEPGNRRLKDGVAAGVTTVLYIPGSGTNMGGHGVLMKTAGETLEEIIIENPGSLKIAQAGNPEWYFGGVSRSLMNWNLRQTLRRARDYHERWVAFERGEEKVPPRTNPAFEPLRGLWRREFPISLHTQWYQVALQSMTMLRRDLGVDIFIDHGTFEAWKLGSIAVDLGVPVINGPRQFHFDRQDRQMQGNAWGWWKEGVRELGINTDSGVIPQHELTFQAAMAVHFGWDDALIALRGLTAVPARTMNMEHRIGRLAPGLDADLALWSGDPLDPASWCMLTVVNGKIAYDAQRDGRRF